MSLLIEVRTSGPSKNIWARGWWHAPVLPYWHACTAFCRAMEDVAAYEPRHGVAIHIRNTNGEHREH